MKSKEEFIKLVDNDFFKHLNTKSLIPFGEPKERQVFLGEVYDNLFSNLIKYKPKSPRKYISTPKSRYVIRMVPTFELEDYCIYYFCLKVLENYLAKNRVIGTFGGYRMGGKIRAQENQEFEPSCEDSFNENSFNLLAWKQEYGEYQAKLREIALKMGNEYQFAVHFDIANFYDCIRLDLLEKKIKARVGNDPCHDEIHLLIQFLKYWNVKFDSEKSVGIPQDEIGDCSRLLANFFLQDYDQCVFDACKEKGAFFLRYADDQIIFAKSKDDAEELLYLASHKLFVEGLNINSKKTTELCSYQEFDDVYGFSIFEKLKFGNQDINCAFELFMNKKNSCANFRESSVLKRMLHDKIEIKNLSNQNRIKLLFYLWNEDFILFANDHYIKQIYKLLKDDGERKEYLNALESIGSKTKFESYKIYLNRFKLTLNIEK